MCQDKSTPLLVCHIHLRTVSVEPSPGLRFFALGSRGLQTPTTEVKRRFRLWGSKAEGEPVGTVIGAPFNVQHVTHVKPDSRTSTGEAPE